MLKVVERYSDSGELKFFQRADGRKKVFHYQNGRVVRMLAEDTSRSVFLVYDPTGQVSRITLPDGEAISYEFNGPTKTGQNGMRLLTAVIDSEGHARLYHYNEQDRTGNNYLPSSLTGITSRPASGSQQRLSSYEYDYRLLPVSTSAQLGVDRFVFLYQGSSGADSVAIADPLGAQRVIQIGTSGGLSVVTQESQPGGSGCGPASSSITYDTQANVTSRTDFTNRKTCYANDLSRNLETARVEGLTAATACPTDVSSYVPTAGTEQRKQLTQWHPDWRLETRRAEPKKLTTWVYNGQPDPTAGNAITTCAPTDALVDGKPIAVVCKQVEQATSDETGGAGFGATAVGTARIQRWTYNRWGQVLTANGPRTDNPDGRDDLTTYEYYADTQTDWTMGDLKQVTNALGHVTRYPKYDRNGRLLQQIDPNGAVTDTAYTPRGWLREVKLTPAGSQSSQTTVYEYDPVGQMTKATLPDGTSTTYTYDAARRLTDVTDSAGNRVSYTLDAMGNRTREEWKDPGGTLRKTITRTIDALNRVQQVVGAGM
jgi:YD repeat-containing protein